MKRSGPRRPRHRPKYANLRAYVAATGDTQINIARALGISQAQISRILAGNVMPRPALAIALAAYARIPVESFTWDAVRQKGVA